MKIAYNPKTVAALTTAPDNDDITFDLSGMAIYAKGVKVGGTYLTFKKHTASSNTGGYDGLVPVPSYNSNSTTRFLREDGTWVVPTNTSYTFANGTDGSFTVTPSGGSGQKVTIGKPATAGTADKVSKALTIKIKTGATEGTDIYTYNGSAAKTLDIKQGTGITLTAAANALTITNSGVRSIATGTTNGTISVNTNGTSTDVAVKGLGDRAFDSTKYLPLTGGTITSTSNTPLLLTSNADYSTIRFKTEEHSRYFGINSKGNLFVTPDGAWDNEYAIWHGGNDGSGSGLDADLLDGKHLSDILKSNVSSATKLQTARKLWGLDFDGTADVNGDITINATGNKDYFINFLYNSTPTYSWRLGYLGSGSGDANYFVIDSSKSSGGTWHRALQIGNETLDATFSGTVTAPTFKGNLDGTYINKLTGYTKATSASNIAATDTLNAALGKLEYKAHYAYDWVIGVTATDTDEYINKWSEIVGFLDSVKEGTDILDEFVTRKTNLDITGLKRFVTSTNEKPLIICRNAGTTEALKIGVTDNQAIFDYDNDEKSSSFVFKMVNTDVEASDGSGANTSQVTFVGSASGSTITADTLAGKLNNTLTFSAGTFSAKTYNNSGKVTVAIPTHTNHLINNSGFLTQHQDLSNYVTLNTYQEIKSRKLFESTSEPITVRRIHDSYPTYIGYTDQNETLGYIGVSKDHKPVFYYDALYTILYAGNYTSYLPKLNDTSTHATNSSIIYAPTTAGTSGYVLKSNGSGAPTWLAQSSIAAGSATYIPINSITAETSITETGLRAYSGGGSSWTGSVTSMAYAGIIALGTPSRGLQIWARRGTGTTGNLRFRVGNADGNAWETERVILDNVNSSVSLSGQTLTVKINGVEKSLTNTTGYVGTTAVQASSATQALTGISSITSTSRLTLNAVDTALDLKFNNDNTKSVILNGSSFKPFNDANGKLSLGSSSARWTTVYALGGNFSGTVISNADHTHRLLLRYAGTTGTYADLQISTRGTACTTEGTAGTTGVTYLLLGNSTAVSTTAGSGAENAVGVLRLYGSSSGYTNIRCGTNNGSGYTLYLPGANGQFVYHDNDTAVGSAATPVYVTSGGKITECTIAAGSGNTNRSLMVTNGSNGMYYTPTITGNYATGSLISTVTDTTSVSHTCKNSNGSVSLYAATNRGLYDSTNSDWIIYLTKAADHVYVPKWANKGSATQPVYFNSSGEPVVCTSYTDALDSRYVNVAGDTMTGLLHVRSVDNTAGIVYGGAIEIREKGHVTTTQTAWEYSPAISFHWGGRHVKRLGLTSNGNLCIDENVILHAGNYTSYTVKKDGTGATGTWGINISGNAANADTVDGVHLEWSGSQAASSTTWLTGWTSDGTKLKAVKQADLSVNYANSAGSILGYSFKNLSAQSHSGWVNSATDNKIIPTMSFIAYWNGAYSSGGASNLAYCDRGRFGTIVTKNAGDYAAASHTHSYLPLSGGTLSSSSALILRAGSSTSWYLGRSNAMMKINSYSGYNAIASMKTTNGDWSIGVYSSDYMYFTYVTDTNFNAGSNTTSCLFIFRPDGTIGGKADDADKVDGYHIAVQQSSAGTDANTIYFVI